MKKLIDDLKFRGYKNIIVLDNLSTYNPLLDYYKNSNVEVVFLEKNFGFDALWKCGLWEKQFKNSFYVYSDPDMLPIKECPDDFLRFFKFLLHKYRKVDKVGFGLKIDDLPDHYSLREDVIKWESKIYQSSAERNVFFAKVDTTFALYRPNSRGVASETESIRTKGLFMARHLPWYENSKQISSEIQFYMDNSITSTHWTSKGIQKNA